MIPAEILAAVEKESQGLNFGQLCVIIQFHDGKVKYRITKEVSIIPGKLSSGQKEFS